MPVVTSGKVLLTGANGYIAVWIVKTLLDAGYAVRGTVRSERKATHLRNLFSSAGDRFEVVIIEDIAKEGAFNDFIQDVAAIVHNATPVHLNAVEPDEMIIPAPENLGWTAKEWYEKVVKGQIDRESVADTG
ncbi:NAD(P)-binding protein [Trametes sanguinea]|nr:NAD(P)-binding protein [Trametes sanguinea]